jgi:hypothetical protein
LVCDHRRVASKVHWLVGSWVLTELLLARTYGLEVLEVHGLNGKGLFSVRRIELFTLVMTKWGTLYRWIMPCPEAAHVLISSSLKLALGKISQIIAVELDVDARPLCQAP